MKVLVIILLAFVGFAIGSEVVFINVGSYQGTANGETYKKSYYYSKHLKTSWIEAVTICNSFGMEIASFKTAQEMEAVRQLLIAKNLPDNTMIVGGMALTPRSRTDWYWVTNDEKISFDIPWGQNQPDFDYGSQWCLFAEKNVQYRFRFHDGRCSVANEDKFLCNKLEFVEGN